MKKIIIIIGLLLLIGLIPIYKNTDKGRMYRAVLYKIEVYNYKEEYINTKGNKIYILGFKIKDNVKGYDTKPKYDSLNEIEDISIRIKEDSLNDTMVTLLIKSNSEEEYLLGEWYRIDKIVNDEWIEVDKKIDNYGFNAIGYRVKEEIEFKINWEWLYGKLDKGYYRIVKEVNDKYISVEFTIW